MALAGAFDGQEKESVLCRFSDLISVGVDRCPLCRWGEHCQRSSQVRRLVKRKKNSYLLFFIEFRRFWKTFLLKIVFFFSWKRKITIVHYSGAKAESPTSFSFMNFSRHYLHWFLSLYLLQTGSTQNKRRKTRCNCPRL